jgi:hypothetical protein
MTGSSLPVLPRMYLRQPGALLAATLFCAVAAGVFAQDVVAYLCIALPATLPLLLWLRAGALAIPILPVISGLFFVYYAIPLLRGQSTAYGSDELIQAGTAVAAFLVAASMASWPFQRRSDGRFSLFNQSQIADLQLAPIVFVGLCAGIVFHLAVVADSLAWLGSSFGLLRSVVLTLASISCYLLGHTRALGLLAGPAWAFAFGGLLLLILLALSNLFLVGGLMYCLAAFLGYVITAKRIPWLGLGTAFAMLAVLHAGKFELRNTYWANGVSEGREISVGQIPSVMVDWFAAGVDALWSGGAESDVLERASLLHMLVLVQRATPDYIPYLEGETYALLPSMLVPRFVDPEKTVSQAGLNLLSIRYGLQTLESVARTTIGWGLVSEAYANFGYSAVIMVGALFGAICGALMRLSVGAPANSLPMFITIAATLVLLNVEADFAYLLTSLVQTLAAILIVAALAYLLRGQRRVIVPVAPAASARVHQSIGDASLP